MVQECYVPLEGANHPLTCIQTIDARHRESRLLHTSVESPQPLALLCSSYLDFALELLLHYKSFGMESGMNLLSTSAEYVQTETIWWDKQHLFKLAHQLC